MADDLQDTQQQQLELAMHGYNTGVQGLADAVTQYTVERMRGDRALGGPRSEAALTAAAGQTITETGLGAEAAFRLFKEILQPATIASDHPRHLSYVPNAPTESAVLFDLALGASAIFGGGWDEGAGAIWAENQALRWLADLAEMPAATRGIFLSGGTIANLSALTTARDAAARSRGARPPRWRILTGEEAHSSIDLAARVMDIDIVRAPSRGDRRLHGESVASVLRDDPEASIFAVVASAGTTNAGIVDDLSSVAAAAQAHQRWLHVDAAYGGAALCAPSARAQFAGIGESDSLVIDPHKWLFAPYDVAALLYRNPTLAGIAHAQHASYLEHQLDEEDWNPSDYAIHLTRRARGLPFWFSLATHGTKAYTAAVEHTLSVARHVEQLVQTRPWVQLVRPVGLSVALIRRPGWDAAAYARWSQKALEAQLAFVIPTEWQGEPVLRFCIVNPRTTVADLATILDALRSDP